MLINDRKKALFIDRDGVIVKEGQIDSFEKIVYVEHVFEALRTIERETDYTLVLVSNQDGVGTPSFPFEDYQKVSDRIFQTLNGEDIEFDDVNVDFSLDEDRCPGRKPGTAMLEEYIRDESYSMEHSFMIGDRLTDMSLAKNLGAKGIWLTENENEIPEKYRDVIALKTDSWLDIASFLTCKSLSHRKAFVERVTNETEIHITLDLDGTGKGKAETGLGFFDHMLDQVIRHSRCDADIHVHGDLFVDEHHSIEDVAIALGDVFLKALGDKRGIERYGFFILPMDEVVATVALDFSGRPDFVWDVEFKREYIGDMPTEMIRHFFKSFSSSAKANLYVSVTDGNSHHMAEAIFKGFAKALRRAVKRIPDDNSLPSTKGSL